MLPFLSGIADRIVGLDLDIGPHKTLRRYVSFPRKVEVHDVNEMPLPSLPAGAFDVVIALDVLEHVSDLESTLSELARILKREGQMVISGPTENLAYRIGRRLAGKEYSGDYHVRNIYQIAKALSKSIELQTLATLYYPIPFFKVYGGRKRQV